MIGNWGLGTLELQQVLSLYDNGLLHKVYCSGDVQSIIPKKYIKVLPQNYNEVEWDKYIAKKYLRSDITEGNYSFLGWRSHFQQQLLKESNHNGKIFKYAGTSYPLIQTAILDAEKIIQRINFGLNSKQTNYGMMRYNMLECENLDYISCASNLVKETFLQSGFDEEQLSVLHLGVDTDYFHPFEHVESDTFRIGFLATNWVRKGLPYLMKEFGTLQTEKKTLLIRSDITTDAPNVQCYPYLDNIKYIYDNSDITVLPTIEDGFAMTVLESMACGVPVLTTKMCGAAELIENGVNGFVYDTPMECAKAIHNIHNEVKNNGIDLHKIGKNARKTAEQYTWKDYREGFSKWLKLHL